MSEPAALPIHRVEPGILAAMANGGGVPLVRWLAGVRRSRTMLLVRAVRDLAEQAAAGYAALAQVHRVAPHAAEAVLASPLVGAWAAATAAALSQGAAAAPEWLPAVAAAAAVRGGVAGPIRLGPGPVLVLPEVGSVAVPPGQAATYADGAFRAGGRPLPLRPVPRIEAVSRGLALRVTVCDLDWYAVPAEPPPMDWWRLRLAAGWQLLVRHHRPVADEVAAAIRMVAPMATNPGVLNSVTYRDAFGCVGMTLPPDPRWAALTLAHEVQHAKLSVLTDAVALTVPDTGARFYAPWREDPRPASGLLQGLYAHVGVAEFWRRQRRHEPPGEPRFAAEVEYARWREACALATDTLRGSGLLTPEGRGFVAALRHRMRPWAADPVPAAAVAQARAEADRHRARWAGSVRETPAQ